MNQDKQQNTKQFAEAIISASVNLGKLFYLLNGEAHNQEPGDNASLTDKASTRKGLTVVDERHGNDISREQ